MANMLDVAEAFRHGEHGSYGGGVACRLSYSSTANTRSSSL
jgi:hypothetical protein